MKGFSFNPADIQSVGIGLAAFLAVVLTLFLFLSARSERLGRAMCVAVASASIWAWFGFFYHVVSDLALARHMRILSVIGIVLMSMAVLNFAIMYLAERVVQKRWVLYARQSYFFAGAVLIGLLTDDLFGARYIVGNLDQPTHMVLAPTAGPWMIVLIFFYAVGIMLSGILLAWRVRVSQNDLDRRRSVLLFVSMTLGLTLGGLRFTPWYGFDFYPLLGDVGFPLFAFAALYSITRYGLLSLQVVAAQLLIFILWTLTFFRILLEPSLSAALPDVGLFLASVVLGVLLLRSAIAEIRTQKELAKLTIDQSRSEFITVAAHQLRTPASALRWTFNLLQEDQSLSKSQRETVELGSRAADNMADLINDLLDVGRIADNKVYEFESGNVSSVLQDIVKSLDGASRAAGVSIALHIAPVLPEVNFDRRKLSMALQNLIDNALKYTKAGGKVSIGAKRDSNGVRITISDTGTGFTEDEKKRAFEKFFRGTRAIKISPNGTGLGLVIAKTIIDAHHGTITLDSSEGAGSVFTIFLPGGVASGT